MLKLKIKKGDNVKVLSGKERGKTGTVTKAMPETGRVMIEGLNMFAKRMRPRKQNQKGETVMVPRSLAVSNVMIVCPNCKKAVRLGSRVEGSKRVRFCRKCQAAV
ncbi:MAG: 50S ribosomal protein L24 [Patescibacteria group bacterium]